jgi:hypothetical protein
MGSPAALHASVSTSGHPVGPWSAALALDAEGCNLVAVIRRTGQLASWKRGQPLFCAGESVDAGFWSSQGRSGAA